MTRPKTYIVEVRDCLACRNLFSVVSTEFDLFEFPSEDDAEGFIATLFQTNAHVAITRVNYVVSANSIAPWATSDRKILIPE